MTDWTPHAEDATSIANASLERWLEDHKHLLTAGQGMPMVDDYILVVAFRDVASRTNGGFATLKTVGSPIYRIRGLLEIGLDFYSVLPPGTGRDVD
jgi:hypothetical protein